MPFTREQEQIYREAVRRKHRENRQRPKVKRHLREKQRECHQRPEVKVKRKGYDAKRRRSLGFVPINEPFEGADAHHIDKVNVFHIAEKLHRSVRHCVRTGEGMNEINAKVLDSLGIKPVTLEANYQLRPIHKS